MAYYDYNGTITIDEQAARSDIQKIQNALPNLQAAKSALDRLISEGSTTQGNTGTAIVEKANELNTRLAQLIQALEETKSCIQQTVVHYQRLDAEVKAAIAAANLGGK